LSWSCELFCVGFYVNPHCRSLPLSVSRMVTRKKRLNPSSANTNSAKTAK
jgi:hypothetical protein